jgi:hypothetical protein
MRILQWTLLLLLLAGIHSAGAMERFDLVTTEELQQMLAARDKGEIDFLLVCTLDEIIYRDVAIPGSISVPWSRVDETIHLLGEDHGKLVVTYCMGYR